MGETGPIAQPRRGARRALVSVVGVVLLVGVASLPAVSPAYGDETPSDRPRLGGGLSIGTINYVGELLPKALSVCARNLTFTLGSGDDPEAGWQSDAFVLNAPGTQYAGPVRLTGGGGSDTSCESYSVGGGVMTMELSGVNPLTGATLACNNDAGRPLTGRYTRIASHLTVIITGHCVVNGTPTGQITFVVVAEAVPSKVAAGEGYTSHVRSMATTGVLLRSAP